MKKILFILLFALPLWGFGQKKVELQQVYDSTKNPELILSEKKVNLTPPMVKKTNFKVTPINMDSIPIAKNENSYPSNARICSCGNGKYPEIYVDGILLPTRVDSVENKKLDLLLQDIQPADIVSIEVKREEGTNGEIYITTKKHFEKLKRHC